MVKSFLPKVKCRVVCKNVSRLALSHDSYLCPVPRVETYRLSGTDRIELNKDLSGAK